MQLLVNAWTYFSLLGSSGCCRQCDLTKSPLFVSTRFLPGRPRSTGHFGWSILAASLKCIFLLTHGFFLVDPGPLAARCAVYRWSRSFSSTHKFFLVDSGPLAAPGALFWYRRSFLSTHEYFLDDQEKNKNAVDFSEKQVNFSFATTKTITMIKKITMVK